MLSFPMPRTQRLARHVFEYSGTGSKAMLQSKGTGSFIKMWSQKIQKYNICLKCSGVSKKKQTNKVQSQVNYFWSCPLVIIMY